MSLKRFYFLPLFSGLATGVGAGIYVLSAYEQEIGIFKYRLLHFFYYPAFALLGLYSALLVIKWLAKASICLQPPPLSEIQLAKICDGGRRLFYVAYMSIGAALATITGYSAGVIGTIFYGRVFL